LRRKSKVKCTNYGRKDIVIEEKILQKKKEGILCPEYRIGKRKPL